MAQLYEVKVKAIDFDAKTAVINVETIHPDALFFSDNLAFALRLVYDAAQGDSPIARNFDANCLFDDDWIGKNAKGYITKCELNEVRSSDDPKIKTSGNESYWFGENGHASATMTITFASGLWMKHLNAKSVWRSTAYPADVDFADREPIDPANDKPDFSSDYANSGGWLLVKSAELKESEKSWPNEIFVPIYTEKSYRRATKLAGADLNKQALDDLLFQTVFSLDRNGFKNFGILTPQSDDRYSVISYSKGGYSWSSFGIQDLLTFGPAEFNTNDDAKAERFSL